MAHNGGIVQINMPHIQYGGGFEFLNHFLNGQTFTCIVSAPPNFANHDDNGYMHTLYGGGVYKRFYIPSQDERPGNYVALWDGGGRIYYNGTLASGQSKTGLAAIDNRCEFVTPASTTVDFGVDQVASDGVDYPHNMAFCHVDDEVACKAGLAYIRLGLVPPGNLFFGVKFLQRLALQLPSVIRFLDSNANNTSNHATWGNRKPITYYDFAGGAYVKKSIYAGITGGSDDDYTVALSGFTLVDKAQAIVRFDRTSAGASPRINIEGTGLKYMKDAYVNNDGGDAINYSVRYPLTTATCGLTYDADLDCYIMSGGSAETNYGGVCPGWPIEIMMALCVHVGAHCSIPVPKFALDPPTDLLAGMCAYASTVLTPAGLKIMLEGPNEEWNTSNGFTNYYYAYHKNAGNIYTWYGAAIDAIAAALEDEFPGGAGTQYEVCCGVHTYGDPTTQAARVTSSATQIHITGYWNASKRNQQEETDAAAAYAAAVGDEAKAAVVDAYMSAYVEEGLQNLFARYLVWKNWITANYPSATLAQYEGGYSPDYTGTSEVNTFRAATKNWPGLYRATCKNYRTFTKVYGGIDPSIYFMAGNTAWGVLDPNIWTDDSPQWTAAVDTAAGKWPFRLTTS